MPPLASLLNRCRCQLFADLVQSRLGALLIAVTGAAQLLASTHGVGLPCPFHQLFGIPCPGCGLTRSVLALSHGNFRDSIAWHPYGIPLAAGLLACGVSLLLPAAARSRLSHALATFEQKTFFTTLLLAPFPLVWLLRLTHLLPFNPA